MKLDLSRCLCVYSSKYEMEANTKKMLGREIRKFQDILYRHMPFTLCVCVCVCVCVWVGVWLHFMACGILVHQAGIEPMTPAVEVRSLNHWPAREVQYVIYWYLANIYWTAQRYR